MRLNGCFVNPLQNEFVFNMKCQYQQDHCLQDEVLSLKGLRVDKQTPHLHAIVFDVFALFCDIIIKQVLNLSAHTRIYIYKDCACKLDNNDGWVSFYSFSLSPEMDKYQMMTVKPDSVSYSFQNDILLSNTGVLWAINQKYHFSTKMNYGEFLSRHCLTCTWSGRSVKKYIYFLKTH